MLPPHVFVTLHRCFSIEKTATKYINGVLRSVAVLIRTGVALFHSIMSLLGKSCFIEKLMFS